MQVEMRTPTGVSRADWSPLSAAGLLADVPEGDER